MKLELWARVGHRRPGGLCCKERQADVGNDRSARACPKGGDMQISSVKRLLLLQCGEWRRRGGGGGARKQQGGSGVVMVDSV